MRVVHAYITSMVGSVDVIAQDQSLDDPLEDGACMRCCFVSVNVGVGVGVVDVDGCCCS